MNADKYKIVEKNNIKAGQNFSTLEKFKTVLLICDTNSFKKLAR